MSLTPPRAIAEVLDAATSPIAPLAVRPAAARTWGWVAVYFVASALVLGVVGAVVATSWAPTKEWALAQVVPDSWRFAARWLIEHFFSERERHLTAVALATGSLFVVTLTLFPLKEQVSRSYEERARLLDGAPIRELPLWEQAWQELKLFGFFVAVQGSLFWVALPGGRRARVAAAIGLLFLCWSYAIDFVSPIVQRQGGRYSQILKLLARTPVASLVFGAIFAAPSFVVGRLWAEHPEWSAGRAVALVFAGTIVGIAWAALAGTWFGARLMPRFRTIERSRPLTRVVAWLAIAAVLAGNAYGFGSLALALRDKSQILKCDYRVDLASFRIDTSALAALLDDEAALGVRFDVEIENPTAIPVALEASRIELRHRGDLVASGHLKPIAVAARSTATQTIAVDVSLTPSMLRRGRDLLRSGDLGVVLIVQINEHIDFPIRLGP